MCGRRLWAGSRAAAANIRCRAGRERKSNRAHDSGNIATDGCDYGGRGGSFNVARGINPGSVVLHRLNRTEYANVIHDLLDIEIDPSKFLPPDDSARGFDNVAGSLTISPTLLEAYTTAASRIARMAVGYWKAPTEASYIAPGDVGQTHHIEGLPLGTRGGMLVHHNFPADGEYKFSVQNFGVGTYWPGEKLEFLVDGVRVKLVDYVGVGLSQGMSGEHDGSIDVTVPVKAGSHAVGVTFL